MNRLQQETLRLAAYAVGVMEVPLGSNRGPQVEMYQKSVGIPPGDAWCAAFVYYQIRHASSNLDLSTTPYPRSGSCQCVLIQANTYTQYSHCIVRHSRPAPGDVFIEFIGGDPHHTGLVESVDADGLYFRTIEGNSNATGSAEGIGVFRLHRYVQNGKYVFLEYGIGV